MPESMSNITLWQYLIIGGPCAVLGGVLVWWIDQEYIRGLESLLLCPYKKEPEVK